MHRRRVLKLFGAATLLGALGVPLLTTRDKVDLIEEIILSQLDYLDLDRDEVKQFARDHVARWPIDKRSFRFYKYYFSLVKVPVEPFHTSYRAIILSTCAQFLRSTDFFQHQQRTDRRVHYIGYFDPYLRPCTHPQPFDRR